METLYFKIIGQKAGDGRIILVMVLNEELLGQDLPSIFELQALKLPCTVYTGIYPTIKINSETLKDRDDLKGIGIGGIITSEQWYCAARKEQDIFGISI